MKQGKYHGTELYITGDLLSRLRHEKTNALIMAFNNFSVSHLITFTVFLDVYLLHGVLR